MGFLLPTETSQIRKVLAAGLTNDKPAASSTDQTVTSAGVVKHINSYKETWTLPEG